MTEMMKQLQKLGIVPVVVLDRAEDALPLVREMLAFILGFAGPIPGATAEECGNYREQNLDMAQYYARKYRAALEDPCLVYPEDTKE